MEFKNVYLLEIIKNEQKVGRKIFQQNKLQPKNSLRRFNQQKSAKTRFRLELFTRHICQSAPGKIFMTQSLSQTHHHCNNNRPKSHYRHHAFVPLIFSGHWDERKAEIKT